MLKFSSPLILKCVTWEGGKSVLSSCFCSLAVPLGVYLNRAAVQSSAANCYTVLCLQLLDYDQNLWPVENIWAQAVTATSFGVTLIHSLWDCSFTSCLLDSPYYIASIEVWNCVKHFNFMELNERVIIISLLRLFSSFSVSFWGDIRFGPFHSVLLMLQDIFYLKWRSIANYYSNMLKVKGLLACCTFALKCVWFPRVLPVKPSKPSCWMDGKLLEGSDVKLSCKSSDGSDPITYKWERVLDKGKSLGKLPNLALIGKEDNWHCTDMLIHHSRALQRWRFLFILVIFYGLH